MGRRSSQGRLAVSDPVCASATGWAMPRLLSLLSFSGITINSRRRPEIKAAKSTGLLVLFCCFVTGPGAREGKGATVVCPRMCRFGSKGEMCKCLKIVDSRAGVEARYFVVSFKCANPFLTRRKKKGKRMSTCQLFAS